MTLYQLVFILLFLTTIVLLIVAASLFLRGRGASAVKLLRNLAIAAVVYLGIVAIVATRTPQRVLDRNEDLCFDEMCFALTNLQTAGQIGDTRPSGTFYIATIRVTSHSRGRTQGEGGLRATLWSPGFTLPVSQSGQNAYAAANGPNSRLSDRIAPGQSIDSVQVFDVPSTMTPIGIALDHGFTPGYFVLGESPLFHAPTITRLSTR